MVGTIYIYYYIYILHYITIMYYGVYEKIMNFHRFTGFYLYLLRVCACVTPNSLIFIISIKISFVHHNFSTGEV